MNKLHDKVMTDNKHCLPEGVDGDQCIQPAPPCPEETCTEELEFIPYIPPCPQPMPPALAALQGVDSCCWEESCVQSVPPAIGCPPVQAGWGKYDGGVAWWAKSGTCSPEDCPDINSRPHLQRAWESLLDHETSDQYHAEMPIYRNNQIAKATPQQFINHANRIAQIASTLGWLAKTDDVPVKDMFGLGYTATGTDVNGKPTYGLNMTYEGQPIGETLPLEVTRDSDGNATGVSLPVSLIQAAEA